MAAKPVALVSGDTWKRSWIVRDDNAVSLNLTGCSARLHLRNAVGEKVAEATTQAGSLVINGAEGRVDMTLPAAAMRLPPERYRFALELLWASGEVRTIETQTLVLSEDVTHD